ncbi:uncharacterized protein LOC129746492 [Uranotaenia lowii]|uniref:uncharacterized protein LOC129746492 n=1 Tax=Uranotaenia lowii TaxID=190385 RepID=UPI002479074E|nr:uncharacterized protein LOC129746492 [Uranotaenia lowii]
MFLQEFELMDEEPDFSSANNQNQVCTASSSTKPAADWIFTKHDLEYLYPRIEHQVKEKIFNPINSVLDAYWPVYVNSFKVTSPERGTWYDEIASYFAVHGLITRMVYFHDADVELFQYQQKYQVLDFLVYFVSKDDAESAIRRCHRQLRYGYHLNVACGRVRAQLVKKRSLMFTETSNMFSNTYASKTSGLTIPLEFHAESTFAPFGTVDFITRYSTTLFAIEFESKKEMGNALRSQMNYAPVKFRKKCSYKQRFVEYDVRNHLKKILYENPNFLNMMPKPHIMQFFLRGENPITDLTWRNSLVPVRSLYGMQQKRLQRRECHFRQKLKRQAEKLLKQKSETSVSNPENNLTSNVEIQSGNSNPECVEHQTNPPNEECAKSEQNSYPKEEDHAKLAYQKEISELQQNWKNEDEHLAEKDKRQKLVMAKINQYLKARFLPTTSRDYVLKCRTTNVPTKKSKTKATKKLDTSNNVIIFL